MKIKIGLQKTGKVLLLFVFSVFTAFPFLWMMLSALKTKAEIMDVSKYPKAPTDKPNHLPM